MLPRSREWKHYFSLRHLNINLCDLFISPDVPVQSRLHQLPNRVAALFSPRRSSSELLFSHFRKKKQAGVTLPRLADVSPAEAKKKFSADFKSQSGCRCCCCCSTWSRTDVFLLRNFHFLSRLPQEILGSTILLRTFSYYQQKMQYLADFLLCPALLVLTFHLRNDSKHACQSYTVCGSI